MIFDGITVTLVEDAGGSMDISLFAGPLSEPELKAYFKRGDLPSPTNIFLLEAGGRRVLLDAGWGRESYVTGCSHDKLATMGVDPEMIDSVIMTHLHVDHAGGLLNDGKAVFPNARVWASRPEADFCLKDSADELVRQIAAAYNGRFQTFNFGDSVLPGVEAVDAVGHTPGHAAFLVGSGAKRLLVGGDFVLAAAMQFERPEEYSSYDADPEKTVASRRALLERAAAGGFVVAGSHLPCAGTVEKSGGAYSFIPLSVN